MNKTKTEERINKKDKNLLIILILSIILISFAFYISSIPENYKYGTINNFCNHYNMKAEHLCNSIYGCCIKIENNEIVNRVYLTKINGAFVFER
jgi:hypothetical protein